MLILALSVAGCAGYFSVWGLSQLFAGASTAVIIMATVLEVGKVVTTTALHRYWSKLAKVLKTYLTISVIVLMMITSAGIYGFLSNAYQSTANKLELHEGEVAVLTGKKTLFETNISDNDKIVVTKNKRIDQLTNLRTNQENRLDSAKTNKAKDKARTDINDATSEIQKLSGEIDNLNNKNTILSDSVSAYSIKILGLKSNSEVAAEVGPLKYISELTGQPMAKVVNVLILLLIFVFDPLAIALILITNRVFQIERDQPLKDEPKESLDLKIDDPFSPIRSGWPEAKVSNVSEVVEEIEPIMLDEQHNDIENDAVSDAVNDAVNEVVSEGVSEGVNQEPQSNEIVQKVQVVEDSVPKPPVLEEQVELKPVEQRKVRLEDIKEIKESNRGYSVNVPQPKNTNSIERIGTNKVIKNGDNNKVIFRRGQ